MIKPINIILVIFLLATPSGHLSCQKLIDDLFNSELEEKAIIHNNLPFILFHYEVTSPQSIIYGLELYYLKIPLDSVSLSIKVVNKNGNPYKIYSGVSSTQTIALVSGGFWGYNNSQKEIPLGLVISRSKIVSPLINWKYGGVLFQDSGKINIEHISQFKLTGIDEGIQSKPILVFNGQVDINKNDDIYSDRICIGITTSNELIICGAFNKIGRSLSLYEFAEVLANNETAQRPNVKIALGMDGGPSSHLYLPTIDLDIGYNDTNFVPNIIELSMKR